eukprot:1178669-Amphidinium_carterae.2
MPQPSRCLTGQCDARLGRRLVLLPDFTRFGGSKAQLEPSHPSRFLFGLSLGQTATRLVLLVLEGCGH